MEAAGNGGLDLDTFEAETSTFMWDKGWHTMARGGAQSRDSRAILVGASMATPPFAQRDGMLSNPPGPEWKPGDPPNQPTNYGSRIDCFAWGELITTSTQAQSLPDAKNVYFGKEFTSGGKKVMVYFGGTSGAAPIIAAACILLQGLHELLTPVTGTKGVLSPYRAREILSKPANGVTSTDPIGVMPDFVKIIKNEYKP